MMIDDGFNDPYEYMEYLEILASKVENRIEQEEREWEEYYKMYGSESHEIKHEKKKKFNLKFWEPSGV